MIHLFEVFETNNSIYMVLELLNGGSLLDKIKNNHIFTHQEIMCLIRGIANAILHMN